MVNKNDPVQRSAPKTTIVTRPQGNTTAPSIRIEPGALSWYQGAVFVLRDAAHAKARMQPATAELENILSGRILAFVFPRTLLSSLFRRVRIVNAVYRRRCAGIAEEVVALSHKNESSLVLRKFSANDTPYMLWRGSSAP